MRYQDMDPLCEQAARPCFIRFYGMETYLGKWGVRGKVRGMELLHGGEEIDRDVGSIGPVARQ